MCIPPSPRRTASQSLCSLSPPPHSPASASYTSQRKLEVTRKSNFLLVICGCRVTFCFSWRKVGPKSFLCFVVPIMGSYTGWAFGSMVRSWKLKGGNGQSLVLNAGHSLEAVCHLRCSSLARNIFAACR